MKIIKSLKESSLLIKDASKTIKNEAKEQKGRFFGMLLGTIGAISLGNMLTVKRVMTAREGATATSQEKDMIKAGEGTIRAGQNF